MQKGEKVITKCSKMGFLVCLLVLLMVICVWTHIGDERLAGPVSASLPSHHISDGANHSDTTAPRGVQMPKDSDGDGINDMVEKEYGLNPALSDTDGDNKSDSEEGTTGDRDNDGIIDALESALDDSDLDGVPDEYDSENANPDNDTDGDGYGNGLERAEGSDPLDAQSKPADHDKDGIPDNIDADKNPISFVIIKEEKIVSMKGSLGDMGQIYALKEAFDNEAVTYESGVVMQDSGLEDNDGAVVLATKLAPLFISLYKNGSVVYKDKTFEISGEVETEEDKSKVSKFLSENAGLIHYVNDTKVATDKNMMVPNGSAEEKAEKRQQESNKTGE